MPKILIAGAVVLVLGVGAFFLFSRNNSQEITESPTDTLSQNAALSGLDPNSPIICEYTDGTYSTTAYIMQDRARVDGISQGGNTAAVMTRETVWTWDPVTKEGFVVNLNEVNQENVEGMAQDAITRDDLDEKVNSQDANCRI